MKISVDKPDKEKNLRTSAERRLKGLVTPKVTGWVSPEALNFLQRMISTPAQTEGALALLHELQVHQAELSLQQEQLEAMERQLAEDLNHYQQLYELAPFASFVVGHDGRIYEANIAGARLFGLSRNDLAGCPIHSFLAIENRLTLRGLLDRLNAGSPREVCEARSGLQEDKSVFQIVATPGAESGTFLMSIAILNETQAAANSADVQQRTR